MGCLGFEKLSLKSQESLELRRYYCQDQNDEVRWFLLLKSVSFSNTALEAKES